MSGFFFVCKIYKLDETLNSYFIIHLFILAIHYNEEKKYNTVCACFYFITHGMHFCSRTFQSLTAKGSVSTTTDVSFEDILNGSLEAFRYASVWCRLSVDT
jgi:hypothetical protein